MLYIFIDSKNEKLWCITDNKETATNFLEYIKKLKRSEDFILQIGKRNERRKPIVIIKTMAITKETNINNL